MLNNKLGKPTLLIHSNNQHIAYLESPFYLKDGHGATSVLQHPLLNRESALYLSAVIGKVIRLKFDYNAKATKIALKNTEIEVPVKQEKIDFEYMQSYVAEIQKTQLAEILLYLIIANLSNYNLTKIENLVLEENKEWGLFNLKALFGSATRGKRLKSSDRITGNLPFVTAGEANMGISDFIGNSVDIFSKNTITIDMFGSAKYRNYDYGADDHVAVVHTQELDKHAVLFITSAIHKVANAGQFSYSRNFYAKDADELDILLPIKNNQPDYDYMETYIKAIQKLVIKGVVDFADREMQAYQQVIEK